MFLQRLSDLEAYRLPGLPHESDFVYPAYDGNSLVNIPASLCHILDLPPFQGATFPTDILADIGHASRIVFILMDGLALHRFERWISEEPSCVWNGMIKDGLLMPLSSIVPSTTSAAMLSLWTGVCPATHGVVGYELWLKEYGIVTNMILYTPISYQGSESRRMEGSLANAGFQPKNYLNKPTIASHLKRHGIEMHSFHHHTLASSGLSQMLLEDVHSHGFSGAADLWADVRSLLESKSGQRSLTYVYWAEVDHLSHFFGPDDERPRGDFSLFSQAFEKIFLERMKPSDRKDTLLIFTADHGQINTQPEVKYDVANHPRLERDLHIMPTGENRLIFLHVRPGRLDAVQEYIRGTWNDQFHVLPSAQAVSAGLFGNGDVHPALKDRIGDLLLIPRGNHYLWWANKKNHLRGRHGGLHREEMLVPFLAVRL